MCGLIGYNGFKDAASIIETGLKSMIYRGYDSYGYGFITSDGNYSIDKNVGEVRSASTVDSMLGVGHVRWATNGVISKTNAHPHIGADNVILVHNGICENIDYIKEKLLQKGVNLVSDTDSELIAHWIALNKNNLNKALLEIKGDLAILFLVSGNKNQLFAYQRNMPLYLSYIENGNLVASSLKVFDTICESYDFLELDKPNNIYCVPKINGFNAKTPRVSNTSKSTADSVTLKEIQEQKTYLENFVTPNLSINLANKTFIIGCGSSFNAGNVAKFYFTSDVEAVHPDECPSDSKYNYIAISQSGETKDVLDLCRTLTDKNLIVISNNDSSPLSKLSKKLINLNCGWEEGVAATKTFTATLMNLMAIANPEFFCRIKPLIEKAVNKIHIDTVRIPDSMMEYSNFYFVGSNIFHSGNIEASLKFKELSGIHAEAIYTTEIKHGPLAVAGDSIFIFVSSKNNNYKVLETINQVKSHGGKVLTLNDTDGDFLIPTSHHIFVDSISAIVYLQIIACKLGLKKGRNIDKPANLAKCVTI